MNFVKKVHKKALYCKRKREEKTGMTAITGLQPNTVLQIIAEVGTDMSKLPTCNHFASYLGFVPRNQITGGKIISTKVPRIGTGKAIVAVSRKLAIIFYNTLVQGNEYVGFGQEKYLQQIEERKKISNQVG